MSELERQLAKLLHDLDFPDETHLEPGVFYRTLAERLVWIQQEQPGSLYQWLSDEAREAAEDVRSVLQRDGNTVPFDSLKLDG